MGRPRSGSRVEAPVAFVDERLGAARGLRFLLNYVFPDHWSFMLGEIALYSFVILIISGIFLALFFSPDASTAVVYHGSYGPLQGQQMSVAYRSAVELSLSVPGGLLMRQVHHWAALVFVAAIVLHLLRILFTGAFRKPREINYWIGVTLLAAAILEGFCGYSLPDDLLSGMGLAIAWGVALSVPIVGGELATLIWGGRFPGSSGFESRLYIMHVFILPALIATLIGVHLTMIMIQRHTQFRGPGRREDNVIGTAMWPGYALRSLGLFAAVAAILVLLGGLVQINPIWLYGPYHTYIGTNGAQPDWYLGWLIGALRLMPGFDVTIAGHAVIPNPFWGGVLLPGIVFTLLYAFPWIDRRFFTRDARVHHLLDRPRDNPRRSALIAAVFSAIAVIFLAGSADRLYIAFGFGYQTLIWIFRVLFFAVPIATYWITLLITRELRRDDRHPLRGFDGAVVTRSPTGGFERDQAG